MSGASKRAVTMQQARLSRRDVPRVYRWIAPVHDWLGRLVEHDAREKAFSSARIPRGASTLEVAVGTGLNLPFVVRHVTPTRYVGIDVTPAMLDRARKRAKRMLLNEDTYQFRTGDAYDLDFSSGEFGVLVNSYMFDMLMSEDFARVLREFHRVLQQNGTLVLINMTLGDKPYHKLWELLYRVHPPLLGGCRGVRLREYVASAGFDVYEQSFVSQWTFPSEILLCKKREHHHAD